MATSHSHSEMLNQFQHFSFDEQHRLLKEMEAIHRKSKAKHRHSLLELEGLGKEIWEGIDPQKYIDEERKSWDG